VDFKNSEIAGTPTWLGHGATTQMGRVLIVDDNDVLRSLFQRQLESDGFETVGAATGAAGLCRLRADARIGLVLLDLMMPNMDGWRFRREQAGDERLATIPTVIVTGAPLPTVIDAELRAADYLLKPVGREHLLSVVRHHCLRLQPETAVSPGFAVDVRCPYCHHTAGVFQLDGKRSVSCLSCHRDAPYEHWMTAPDDSQARRD
jgi:CheY-like chemotaxis protein